MVTSAEDVGFYCHAMDTVKPHAQSQKTRQTPSPPPIFLIIIPTIPPSPPLLVSTPSLQFQDPNHPNIPGILIIRTQGLGCHIPHVFGEEQMPSFVHLFTKVTLSNKIGGELHVYDATIWECPFLQLKREVQPRLQQILDRQCWSFMCFDRNYFVESMYIMINSSEN